MTQGARFSTAYEDNSRNILEKALREIPAYRSWRVFDPGPDYNTDIRYAAMPALTKKDIQQSFLQDFAPDDHNVEYGLANREIELVKTSGTIDDIVTNIWNQKWWDASERASWQLNSHACRIATGNHREAILVNPLNVGIKSDAVELTMEQRRLSRFLYLNEKTDTLSWSSQHMDRMIRELEVFQPEVLEANPSLLARLCRYATSNRKTVYQPGLIILTYEYPTRFHLQQVRRVFQSPIASSYGTTETGYVFMQCEAGKFHQNSEFCRVDFQPVKPVHGGPRLGRILVTPLNNPWYYLLRFDVGDLVRIEESGSCACGRNSGLILSSIEGRAANLTLTCDGRLVTLRELDDNIGILAGVDEYSFYQTAVDTYELHLVTSRADRDALGNEATPVLKQLYGSAAKVVVIFEEAISPESSGKYRLSRSAFPVGIEKYLAD